ncbi:MAG TPA: tetratricopeptide repeat protein [Flavobacteriales bacterium]|nr:tetratricopeptide repeat protein [Flavobacteriales bacterium]HPH81950.1 tetratricopeptide repeat protein [Flavobacteriales bacterium]
MKITTWSLFVLFLFGFEGISHAQKTPSLLKQADSLIQLGNYAQAIPLFTQLIQLEPKNEKAFSGRGLANIKLGNLAAGKSDFQQAIVLNPACSNCYLTLAQLAAQSSNLKETETLINKAIQIDPKNENAFLMRAELREAQKDYAGSLRDFDQAIVLKPNIPESYIERAGLNERSGYEALAKADYALAIEKAPKQASVYFSRANFFIKQTQWKRALDDLDMAISLDSTQAEYHSYRGSVLYYLDEFNPSIIAYSRSIQLDPTNYRTFIYRGMSWHKLENMDSCCFDSQQAMKLIPSTDTAEILKLQTQINDLCNQNQSSFFYQRGIATYNLGKFEDAIQFYNRGLEKFPTSGKLISFRGNAYKAQGNNELALKDYLHVCTLKKEFQNEIKEDPMYVNNPSFSQIYYIGSIATLYESIAECYSEMGQYDQALTYADSAVNTVVSWSKNENLKSVYVTCLTIRGALYNEKEELVKAKSDLVMACTISSNNPLPHINLAITYIKEAFQKNNKVKTIQINLGNLRGAGQLNLPAQTNKNAQLDILQKALQESNLAINLNPQLAFAYLVRAHIKNILQESDVCLDALMAEQYGIPDVPAQLGISCPNNTPIKH